MKLIKTYLFSLLAVIIVCLLFVVAIKSGLFEKSEPEYFLNVNLRPENRAELEKRREDDFKKLELFSENYDVYMNLGNIERELGNASQAIEYFKKAAKIIPTNVTPWNNIGQIYVKLKIFDKAEQAYLKAKSINPGYYITYLYLAELYEDYLTDRIDEAKGVYLEGLAATNNSEKIQVPFASYLTEIGNYSEALLYWEQLAKEHPENKSHRDMIEYVREKQEINKSINQETLRRASSRFANVSPVVRERQGQRCQRFY